MAFFQNPNLCQDEVDRVIPSLVENQDSNAQEGEDVPVRNEVENEDIHMEGDVQQDGAAPPPPPPPPPIPPRPKLWRFPEAEFGNKGVRR